MECVISLLSGAQVSDKKLAVNLTEDFHFWQISRFPAFKILSAFDIQHFDYSVLGMNFFDVIQLEFVEQIGCVD